MLEEGGIEAFIRREALPNTPFAWFKEDAAKVGCETSFTRHFYMPPPCARWKKLPPIFSAVEKKAEGLLEGIISG